MARAIWSGSISFGLVTVPVKLYSAVRRHDVRFTQLHGETGARVRQRRVDESTGEEVDYGDIVKGYEIGDGRYIAVDRDELDALAPESSRQISLLDFVDIDQVDPIHADRPYYLAPDGQAARKPYRLLVEAMERTGRAGVARFVMRTKEHLALLRPRDGVLIANTLYWADEVVVPDSIEELDLEDVEVGDREVEMAERLISSLATEWDADAYTDEHHERVVKFLEDKAAGREVTAPTAPEPEGEVVDLMQALERSLAAAGQEGAGAAGDGAARAAGDGQGGLSELTRAELYDLAQERDIPGRSSMTKGELVEALSDADAPARKAS